MNEEELGVSIVNASQVFIPEGDPSSLFVDEEFDKKSEEGAEVPTTTTKKEEKKEVEDPILPVDDKKNEPIHVKEDESIFVDDTNKGSINYKQSILELSRLGIIDEVTEDSEFEGEDGEVTKFSDLDIGSEDIYREYVKNLYEEKKRKELEGHIDLKGVSDFTKQIIEIDKAGGNVSAVLQAKSQALDPIQDLDLSNENDQKEMIKHYLNTRYKDLSRDDIEGLIKSYEDRGTLEEKAVNCKEAIEKALSDFMENEKKNAEKAKQQFLESYKTYKKSLKENVASSFQVKEEYAKKLTDFATKLDERNNFENLNNKYREMLSNPQTAAELALFLFDKEEYVRQKTNKAVTEERRTVFKKITTSTKKNTASTGEVLKGQKAEEDEFIPIKEKVVYKGDTNLI